jgi:hypothetical protein
MPVDLDKIKTVKPHLIDYDRPCRHCGYNLMGLMSDAVCPECGRKVQLRKQDLPRYSDNLVNAPMAWLGVLATGSTVLFVASMGLFASMGVAGWLASVDKPIGGIIAAAIGVGWNIGVWMVTRPRPQMKTTTMNPSKEWAAFRWGARGTQIAWVVSALCLMAVANVYTPALLWTGLISFVLAATGLIPLCGYLSNIAYWGSDSTLAGHFRACAWVTGFSAFLTTLHIINIYTRSFFMGGVLATVVAALLIFFVVAPYFYMIFCCFHLQTMSGWALMNHATAEGKTRRMKAQAEILAMTDESAKPPPNIVNEDAFNLGDSDVTSMRGPETGTSADKDPDDQGIPLAPETRPRPQPRRRSS